MSAVRRARTPGGVLHRVGRLPNPAAFPPREVQGHGRFDDPEGRFRVLYAAAQRRGAFVETLAPFRPSLDVLARLAAITGSDEPLPQATIPSSWYERHAVVRLRLASGQGWLDLRASATREALRSELAAPLINLGLTDLDVAHVLGPAVVLTQRIGRWAYEHGYSGLVYPSRLDSRLTLWALVEGAAFEQVGEADALTRDDPDVQATARLYGLLA